MKISIAKPKPFISGSMLKLIAIITMFIDHLASYILSQISFFTNPILSFSDISIYEICRIIGRLAFPLYCFLLVEGFIHTKNRKKYGIRLLTFAFISELPWNYAHSGKLLYSSQNVMFTLFFGYLALCALKYFDKDILKQSFSLILIFFVCFISTIDYGVRGLGLIIIIYLLRDKIIPQAIIASCLLNWKAGLAFIPIGFYNGKRGFMKGSFSKYVGYLFYPVHILILGIIKYTFFN